jgi:DNA-binding response OmpR family regulator
MTNGNKNTLIYIAMQNRQDLSRMEDMLVLDGFDISTFTSSSDLWEHFQARPARIVIVDRRFGDAAVGLDLVRKIRLHHTLPYTYILMRSSMERIEEIEEALAAGADDYIIKPHNPFQMRTRVLVGLRWVAYIDSLFAGKSSASRQESVKSQ